MVLINELTVEQINAALLHLQRSKNEVVGGEKGTTIQNITISNSGGGGNNVDYSGTIKNLATNIEKNKTAIEKNASDIAKLKSDFSNIEKSVEDTLQGLADNGISDLSFDPLTKQLTITTNDGDTYQTVIEQDIGYLSYDSATNKLILTTGNQSQEITLPYIKASEKGSANGVATLDENGRVPYSQLPESAMEFLGQWDASTNTPHLADGTGTNGDFYIVSAGGTVNLGTEQDPHIVTFSINDRIVYEGDIAQWVRLPAGQVSSVNGQSGEVTLTASDIEYSTGVSIKAKIDANAVQADWNVSDTTSLAYIKNKPTIPASPVQSDWNVTDTTSLAYIKNKPATYLVCTSKYIYAYNFDVVLTNTCDSQTQFTWVSANCRLQFCSSTGVLKAACFCGTASCADHATCTDHATSADKVKYFIAASNNDYRVTLISSEGCMTCVDPNYCQIYYNPYTGTLKAPYFCGALQENKVEFTDYTFSCNQGNDSGTNWRITSIQVDLTHCRGCAIIYGNYGVCAAKTKCFSLTLPTRFGQPKAPRLSYMHDCCYNVGGPEMAASIDYQCSCCYKICFQFYNRNSSTALCKPWFLLTWLY